MADDGKKWSRLSTPPAPLFTNKRERDFVKQINDEVSERIRGQQLLYYPIDQVSTRWNIYGEAIVKSFLSPVQSFAVVEWGGIETNFEDSLGPDKKTAITVHFFKRRLTEDQNLFVREGDYILWGDILYEIHKVAQPDELFGQPDHKFEVSVEARKAREGQFDAS